MLLSFKRGFFAVAALALLQVSANAADISMHEVYEAAQAGHLREAQSMMQQVLRDHPTSAKAHYVEAEILSKAGQLPQARSELATAEQLEPGLPFASPSAVQALRERLNSTASTVRRSEAPNQFPWGLALLGVALLAAIVMFVRAMRQRSIMQSGAMLQGPSAFGPGPGYGPNYGPSYGPNAGPMGGGGMGSGILGGLATGAALGAGMVAGEALAHRMMGDGQHSSVVPDAQADNLVDNSGWDPNSNMGGNDFGVSETSSWDDNSSSWDSGGGGDFGGGDWS